MPHGEDKKIRVGVIGAGGVGAIHARAYLDHPSVEFVGICDTDPGRLAEKISLLRVEGYQSVSELIAKGRPDLVSVVVQHDRFEAPIEECFDAGVHVLSEKPISFDPSKILRLMRMAEKSGLRFGVNFNQRFSRASKWFKRLSAEQRFGEILWTLAQYNQDQVQKGFSLREHMIHMFDLWRYHLGEIEAVSAQARGFDGDPHKGEKGVVGGTVRFTAGPIGVFTNGAPPAGGPFQYYEIAGTEGRGYCENFIGKACFRTMGQEIYQVLDPPWGEKGGYYWDMAVTHLSQVVEAMQNDQAMPVPAAAAFEAQCICDAVIQAVSTGGRVDVQARRRELLGGTG